jgi:DHA1 family tetracycline resistance protein-like MFS transporter
VSSDSLTTHLSDSERSRAQSVILFTVFLDILGFGIIIPQLGVYAAQFGATPEMAGLLASTYSAMTFLFTPFWGALSDRYGRRPILLYSIFGTGLSHILFALAGSLPWMFAARALDGITGANISAAQAYLSDITPPEKRSQTFGIFGAIFGIGFALGPLIGWGLSHLPGAWGGNFGLGIVSAVLSFINWGLAVKFMPETLSPAIREANKKNYKRTSPFRISAFKQALEIPNFNIILVIGFIATAAFATMQGSYALYVVKEYARPKIQAEIKANPQGAGKRAVALQGSEGSTAPSFSIEGGEEHKVGEDLTVPYPKTLGGDFDLPNQKAPEGLSWRHVEKLLVRPEAARSVGEIFALIGILSLFVQGGLMRRLPKKVGEVRLVIAGTLLMAIGLALIAAPFPMWWQFLVAAIITLGNGLSTPVLTSLATQYAPDNQRGELLGIYQSTQSLGRIIGPNLGGFLFGAIAAGAPFVAGGVIMLAAFFLAFKLKSAAKTDVLTAPAEA